MQLSVIIPTREREEILNVTIRDLIEATKALDSEIIIVNDSPEGLSLRQNEKKIRIIRNPGSGAASARNAGAKAATGDLLLFLDDDILVTKENIEKTLALHKGKEKSAFNFYWIYPPNLMKNLPDSSFGRYIIKNSLFSNSYRIKFTQTPDKIINTNGLTSQYFSILKSDFFLTGGYDENIPFAGIEDLILFKSLQKNHIKVFLSYNDIVFQNEKDRIDLFSVLERYRRGAITRKKARDAGHLDLSISFPFIKKIFYPFLVPFKLIFYKAAIKIPNDEIFDRLYFKLCDLLIGLSQFEGYYFNQNNK